jgi:hypothetical protein
MAILVWRGRGVAVPLIAFGCLLVTELATRACFHDETYYQRHGWPKLAGFLVAAAIVRALSWEHEVAPEASPQPVRQPVLRCGDTFFFIPARHWWIVLCGLGVLFYWLPE